MKISAAINRIIADAKSTGLLLSASTNRALVSAKKGLFVVINYLSDTSKAYDALSINATKNLYNASSTLDSINLSLNKSESDVTSSSDNGSLLIQNYVDNSFYFAEDYVGNKHTF